MVLIKSIAKRPIRINGKLLSPGKNCKVEEGEYLKKFIVNKFIELVKEEKKIIKEEIKQEQVEKPKKKEELKMEDN